MIPGWLRGVLACVLLGLSGYSNDALADRDNYWGLAAQVHRQDAYVETDTDSGIRVDTDTSSFGTRLYVGRYLHRHIALESGAMVYRTARARLYSDNDQLIGYLPAQDEIAIDLRLLASFPVGNTFVAQGYLGQRFWNHYQYFPQTSPLVYRQSTEIDTTAGVEVGIGWRRNGLIVLGVDYMDSQPNESISASLGIAFRLK